MQNFISVLWERFGLNAYIRGDYKKAERWFRKLEQREPDAISVLRNLGVILLAKGDAEGAEAYLLREEKLYGKSFHRHAGLADIAYARGKRKEAERRYALALQEPECQPGGKAEASRSLLEKRLAICASEAAFIRSRESMKIFREAEELSREKKYEEAVLKFKEAAALDETNWPALNNAGSIYLNQLGKNREAQEFFEKAFEISKNIQVARNLDLVMRKNSKELK